MDLFSKISNVFKSYDIKITERLDTVEASFTIKSNILENIDKITSFFNLVPERDNMILSLKNDSEDIVFIERHQLDSLDFSSLTSTSEPEDNIYVRVQIDKSVCDGKFSIYNFKTFTDDLLQRPVLEILHWFSEKLRGEMGLKFEVYDYDISFSTRTMAFESCENAIFIPKINRHQRLNSCKDMSCFYNMNTFEVIPDDFIIEGVMRSGECLKPLFGRLATILSIAYIATSATISDEAIDVQISGQRIASYKLPINDIQENEKWQNIYTWIFTDGNPTDKALIAHNVISLHCKFEAILNFNDTVFEAIKTNYNLYLRNNVNKYLDMKRDIAKFIQNVVTQVGDYAVTILGNFKANLIAIFGFLFTVVLTKIGVSQKWDEIFTKHTIYLIELFIGGSLVYLVICIFETRFKLKKTKMGYSELKKNYENVLSEAEIKEAFNDDKILHDTEKSAKKGIIGWSIIWGILLILAILIIEVLTTNHGIIVWLWNKIF